MPQTTQRLPETVAAVDLGSNSFHLLLARVSDAQPVVLDRLREMVQLASGLDRSKRLDEQARSRALACLRRFGQRLAHVPACGVRAVGTNTLRSAQDADEFLAAAEEALGHPIETISGIEEARLIYLGVSHSMPESTSRRLVLDIGGGSTELILGRGFRAERLESLYMGCVTTSRKFFDDGAISQKSWRRAEVAARQELAPVERSFREAGWDEAVGSSGTVRAARSAILALGDAGESLTLAGVRRLRDAMLTAGHVKRLRIAGLNPRRRPYFPGGVAVLLAAMEALGIERMDVSSGALREGLLYDLLGRLRAEDVRARSVSSLADRYHVDRRQAQRVETSATRWLDLVADPWDLADPFCRQLLSWAAQLHEIGLDIAHSHYHKHGEYIVAQADLSGFSWQDQTLLATLVRAHRRKLPASAIKRLPGKWSKRALRLAVLLRLAVVLHRSRSPEPLPPTRLRAGKRSLTLELPGNWLESHPLSRADLEQEAGWLAAARFKLALAEV